MSDDITRLMEANLLEVFDERDRDRRRDAISRTYTPDVVFTDAEGTVTGHEQISAKVDALPDGPLKGCISSKLFRFIRFREWATWRGTSWSRLRHGGRVRIRCRSDRGREDRQDVHGSHLSDSPTRTRWVGMCTIHM